jgi:RNA polymerase sigma-70 factor, ECF subfamily
VAHTCSTACSRALIMADPGTESLADKPKPSNNEGSPGVPESFERLVEEYYQPAYRFAFSLSGNHSDACDITQQAFYLAHTKSHQLRDPTKCKQWLFTILHREFLRMRRRDTAHPHTSMEFSEHELAPINVDHATNLDSKTLLRALERLDEHFRIPLVFFYLDELSYKEIATTLAVPIGTVMSRLARAKQTLRRLLEQKQEEDINKIVPLRQSAAKRGIDG